MTPRISIVIATFNRSELLPRSFPALLSQSGDVPYEVLFVDDGSTDNSRELIEEAVLTSNGTLRYIYAPHTGSPSHPRNVGIRLALAPVVLLLDDDVVPAPDLVAQHAKFHQEYPEAERAALGNLDLPEDVRSSPMSLFHAFPYGEAAAAGELNYLFFWTCNVSVKREFMLQHGMFDENPELHPVEDMECGYRLWVAGMRLRYLPSATGSHLHKMTADRVAHKGQRTGRAQFALMNKVPDLGLVKRFGILSSRLPFSTFAVRCLRRSAFRLVDNPITLMALRALGAERPKRSRISDAYYYLIFRRNTISGFASARRNSSPLQPRFT
jgi:GT2 family glycosyltransferase